MSFSIEQAGRQLDNKTWLLGASRRRVALKALAENPDPSAALALVDAADRGSPSAKGAIKTLSSAAHPSWIVPLWRRWRSARQEWLGTLLLGNLRHHARLVSTEDRAAWVEALPLERTVALEVAALPRDPDSPEKSVVSVYVQRVAAEYPDFAGVFLLKTGCGDRIPRNRACTHDVLRQRADSDTELTEAANVWLSALPGDQQINDVLVDEWLRTGDEFLLDLIRDQRRLPSEGGKEALLLLLWGDTKGYAALGDTDGRLLSEAWAMADEGRRQRIAGAIQATRDGALADQLLRAQVRVGGGDKAIGLQALLATGDEDRIANAARGMNGGELFDLVRRWSENGRRPSDPRKRVAVQRAVAALKDLPRIEVEPAPPLPEGLDDLLEVWGAHQAGDDALRGELQAPDPLIRARALFVLSARGRLDEGVLRAKAKSEDWPERFVAALREAHPEAANDHVYWVSACAGEDSGTQQALVACGPDEFQRAQERLNKLCTRNTPLAKRDAAELQALQAFRELELAGIITVGRDDSAPDKPGIEARDDVDPAAMAEAFGKGGDGRQGGGKRG